LTEQEYSIFRSGAYQLVPNYDAKGRAVAIHRLCHLDIAENVKATARCIWYIESLVEDYPSMQQKGVVTIVDSGGQWKCSALQLLHFLATYPMDATPFHDASMHVIYNDSTLDAMIRKFRYILRQDFRLRMRLHFGSTLETMYSLRTFGIDVSDWWTMDDKRAFSFIIDEDIRKRQEREERWRLLEAPYRDPSSHVALFPNPQDIILGRNKAIALTWSGNILYHKVIQQHAHRYIDAQALGTDRFCKTMISLEIFHILHGTYGSRFLARKDTVWEVIDDFEAQKKISQALRALARELMLQTGGASVPLEVVDSFE
jgi:hypothetical protein